MGSREVQRFFPGKFEAADRDQTRRRRSRGGREAEKTRPRCGPDGGVEAEPGPDGRPEEARRDHQVRGASRRSKISTRKRIELLSAFSVRDFASATGSSDLMVATGFFRPSIWAR